MPLRISKLLAMVVRQLQQIGGIYSKFDRILECFDCWTTRPRDGNFQTTSKESEFVHKYHIIRRLSTISAYHRVPNNEHFYNRLGPFPSMTMMWWFDLDTKLNWSKQSSCCCWWWVWCCLTKLNSRLKCKKPPQGEMSKMHARLSVEKVITTKNFEHAVSFSTCLNLK